MPARTIVLTAVIASCVSSLVTLAATLLVLAPTIRAAPDAQAAQPVVRAERFELVDAQGKLVARLGQHTGGEPAGPGILLGGTSLDFLDQAGQMRASMGLANDSTPGVFFISSQGLVAGIGENSVADRTPAGSVGIVLVGPSPVAPEPLLSAAPDGQSSLQFLDAGGQTRVVQGVRADGTPWTEP
jgi:hypothetical protein